MASSPEGGLHWFDYVVFVGMLVVSLGIGLFHTFVNKRHASAKDYLMAGREINIVPVILSLTASFISAILFLGYPAETYAFGGQYWLFAAGTALGAILAACVYVPLLYPLDLTSVNEYLERRYESRTVKIIGTLCSVLVLILYSATVYYGPATALEAVTGFPTWGSILIGSAVSISYTTLGGLRAVIWTDAFQAMIMLIGMLAIVIQATVEVGGLSTVWDLNEKWNRLDIIDLDIDPTKRMTFWGLTVATGTHFMTIYGVAQMAVQRYSALPSLKLAKISVLCIIPGMTLLTSLACMNGLVIFAYYAGRGCDPLKAGYIDNPNQIMLYFATDVLSYPGLPGLFLAAVWAGSLSSVSSALNSAAANAWSDVMKEILPKVNDATAANITKLLVLGFGVFATALAFLMTNVGGTIVQIMSTFASTLSGPVSALFFLGAFFPWANWIGATVGSIVGFVFGCWVAFGSYLTQQHLEPLPSPVYNCTFPGLNGNIEGNISQTSFPTIAPMSHDAPHGLDKLYSLSFLWMSVVAGGTTVFIAIVVSFITGLREPLTIESELVHPWIRKAMKYPPPKKRKKRRHNTSFRSMSTNQSFDRTLESLDVSRINRSFIWPGEEMVPSVTLSQPPPTVYVSNV